jgi:hypothetical protein
MRKISSSSRSPFNIIYGIDFTKSNGKRRSPDSMHHLSSRSLKLMNKTPLEKEDKKQTIYSNYLHCPYYQEKGLFNPYQQCILYLGSLFRQSQIMNDKEQQEKEEGELNGNSYYQVYGFGAAVDQSREVSHCFSLHPDQEKLSSIKEVLQVSGMLSLSFFVFILFSYLNRTTRSSWNTSPSLVPHTSMRSFKPLSNK